MILEEFKGGCFTVRFFGDDAELLARACTVAGESGGDHALDYHTLATLFAFAALSSQLYGQTPGGEHEDTKAADLLARVHKDE